MSTKPKAKTPTPKAKPAPKFKPPTTHEQIDAVIRDLPSGVSPIAADHISAQLKAIQAGL